MDFEALFRQLRRIEEHRAEEAEAEIRRLYQEKLVELRHYMADAYATLAEGGRLDMAMVQRRMMDARLMEEAVRRVDGLGAEVSQALQSASEEMYSLGYTGMQNAVNQAAAGRVGLREAFSGLRGVTPEQIRAAVQNPMEGLTLSDRLERHRQDIVYDLKKAVGTGLMNGDRYETMAGRMAESLNGDYQKAVRIARTEVHRVREAGHLDAMTGMEKELNGAGLHSTKTWRTMSDERVRPQRMRRTASGWKRSRGGKANHMKMEGVCLPVGEAFDLGGEVKAQAPGQSGDAGNDIHCRCFLEYGLAEVGEKVAENTAKPLDGDNEGAILNKKAVRKTLRQVESEIQGLDHEVGAIVDKGGRLVAKVQGGAHSVSPPKELLKGNIFTHNHPSGGTFSPNDVRNFVIDGLYEVRAITPKGIVHRLRWGEGFRDKALAEDVSHLNLYSKALDLLQQQIEEGQYTPQYAKSYTKRLIFDNVNSIMEQWLKDSAKKYGYDYITGELK